MKIPFVLLISYLVSLNLQSDSQPLPLSTRSEQPTIHEPRRSPLAATLPDEAINAFGLRAGGNTPATPLAPACNRPSPPSIESLAPQLHLQGIDPQQEVIINNYRLTQGDPIKLRVGETTYNLIIKEIDTDAVKVGWDHSDSVLTLSLSEPPEVLSASDEPPLIVGQVDKISRQ